MNAPSVAPARAPPAIDVRALRLRLGLTVEEMARLLGVTRRTILHWQSGYAVPQGSAMVLLLLLDVHGGKMVELLRWVADNAQLPVTQT